MDDASDMETIRAVLAGDVDRYAELVDTYHASALRLAFSLLGNVEDAHDVSQDAFVRAYRALKTFRGEARFSTWLYRIIVNTCRDHWKHQARQPVGTVRLRDEPDADEESRTMFVALEDPGASPSDQAISHEIGVQLSEAVAALSEHQRTAFVLHRIQGWSLEEVACVMRCRVGTVKSHLFRATERVRERLTPWWSTAEEKR